MHACKFFKKLKRCGCVVLWVAEVEQYGLQHDQLDDNIRGQKFSRKMMLAAITVALLCLFTNAAVQAEDPSSSQHSNVLDFIDVEPYFDRAEQRYDTFISKLTALDENVKTLADQLGQPNEGLQELDDQLAILIDKLSMYRDLIVREDTDSANFQVGTAIFSSQEFWDVVSSASTVGQKLTELGDTWDVTIINSLSGIADFRASLLDGQLHVQEMAASSKDFCERMAVLKSMLREEHEDVPEILSNINNMMDAANQLTEAFYTFYDGLKSVKFAIEGQH